MTAGTDYNLVTRAGDGKADIVFAPGHAPVDGAIITATTGANSWSSASGIQVSVAQLEAARVAMRSNSTVLANNINILTTRLDFTDNIINTLQTGAENLILADMNEEAANLLMLQTRQSLATTSLSLGTQAAQAVMRLF